MPKIANKPKKVSKLKIFDKPESVKKNYRNYDEYKNRVIRQLIHLFHSKKKKCIDYDDKEYRGIRELEYLLEGVSEDDEHYYILKE